VIGNVIDNYQKNGTTIDGMGSYADFAFNRVLGIGPTAIIAQNGAQISRGATADVRHNFISGNVYTPQTVTSTGILLFQSGVVHINHNTVAANDTGVDMFDPASGSVADHNRLRSSTYDGVALFPANDTEIAFNWTEQNNGPGIGVYDSQNNSVSTNSVEGNKDSGVLIDNSDSNVVSDNHVRNNGTDSGDTTDGIRINAPSTGNTIQRNHLRLNVTHDCHDNSTGNSWLDNRGDTSFPPGLCSRGDGDDGGDDADSDHSEQGWNASYAWYAEFDVPADFDWTTAYAIVDTDSLLQLLPGINLNGNRKASNPAL
jgi:parallel beta-helix repeat protein